MQSLYLVHKSHDEHHAIYGVFVSLDEFTKCFNKEIDLVKAKLMHSYVIWEMCNQDIIDIIHISEITDSLDVSEEVNSILEKNS